MPGPGFRSAALGGKESHRTVTDHTQLRQTQIPRSKMVAATPVPPLPSPSDGPIRPATPFLRDLADLLKPIIDKSPLQLVADLHALVRTAGHNLANMILGVHQGEKRGFVLAAEAMVLGWLIAFGLTAVLAPVLAAARTTALVVTGFIATWSAVWSTTKVGVDSSSRDHRLTLLMHRWASG